MLPNDVPVGSHEDQASPNDDKAGLEGRLPNDVGSHEDHAGPNDDKEGLKGDMVLQGLHSHPLHAAYTIVGLQIKISLN